MAPKPGEGISNANQRIAEEGDGICKFSPPTKLKRHGPDYLLYFPNVHHDDGVPRAAVQEAAVRTFADTLLAPDAQDRVHLDAPERRMILIRHPEHTIF